MGSDVLESFIDVDGFGWRPGDMVVVARVTTLVIFLADVVCRWQVGVFNIADNINSNMILTFSDSSA